MYTNTNSFSRSRVPFLPTTRAGRRLGGLYLLFIAAAASGTLAFTADADTDADTEKTLVVTATAYNSVPAQTDGDPTIAAWGDTLRPGMKAIAVSPDLIPLGLTHGTRVRIEGLPGAYVVRDRMPARWRRKIDIYMGEDVQAARQWGRREVQIRWKVSEDE